MRGRDDGRMRRLSAASTVRRRRRRGHFRGSLAHPAPAVLPTRRARLPAATTAERETAETCSGGRQKLSQLPQRLSELRRLQQRVSAGPAHRCAHWGARAGPLEQCRHQCAGQPPPNSCPSAARLAGRQAAHWGGPPGQQSRVPSAPPTRRRPIVSAHPPSPRSSLLQFAPAAANVDARQLADAVQGLQLTAEQAHKVERVAHMLHAQLRLPRDDMLRLLPMILRAPVFVQVSASQLAGGSVPRAGCKMRCCCDALLAAIPSPPHPYAAEPAAPPAHAGAHQRRAGAPGAAGARDALSLSHRGGGEPSWAGLRLSACFGERSDRWSLPMRSLARSFTPPASSSSPPAAARAG